MQDSADTLTFGNNSSIRVSTSMRSGTLQYLHVSEFGKICAQAPEKAREIVTGALNTVEAGQFVVIESTAEGQEGAVLRDDPAGADAGRARREPSRRSTTASTSSRGGRTRPIVLDDAAVVIGAEDQRYFERLEAAGLKLTLPQKRWWTRKAETLGGDMRREYPATPDEAFEQALEGAYFAQDLFAAAKQGRIGGFPYDPRSTVQTFWDLGRNDLNTHLAAPARQRLRSLRRLLREQRRVHRPLRRLAEGMGAGAQRELRRPLHPA